MESTKPPANKKKRMSVERIYQKKSQLEHIILRPDSYIGSDQPTTQNMWVWDDEKKAVVSKSITFTPGLYKIFDEIIVNAADNKQRDSSMNTIKVKIDQEANLISIWNNGRGIPVEMHKEEKLFVPTLIFGHLLTSSNYDDTEKKVVGGRNGFGAKLCNIFSTKFTVETACNGKKFKQVWRNNMGKTEQEKITDYSGTDFTCITFSPDLKKFKMENLDDDFVSLIKRRAYDMAGVCRGVSVVLNEEKLKVKSFKDYVNLYVKGASKDGDLPHPKVVHQVVNPRWEICITVSESGFQQASFVNSIATTKGGSHINYIVDQICEKLIGAVKKKTGRGGFNIKPFQVKSHLWVFANCLIENPTFDSQTKENMTLRKSAFGSTCDLPSTYIKMVQDCGILENIMNWVKFKSEAQLNKKTSSGKHSRLKGIPKLDDANDAGTKNSRNCTLIVTEGDSAKALAMAGLSVVGRDKYGVFPLRGKLLNVRDASHKQISENVEIGSLCKIIGLQFGKKYETEADMKNLRYGHLMIMADQDIDGSHIKGLVINFIHAHWPGLLKLPFLEEFITPIVKVIKGNQSLSFFSIPEFEEWKNETPNYKSWRIKYYKGLGTSTSKEGKEYFSNMQRHRIIFEYDGPSCDQAMIMVFSKKLANDRKDWLTAGMAERKMRREADLPEIYLYEKDTKSVTFTDFVNKELILFSNTDNERSIPSMVDGLKPGQRKVLFTCMKRNDKHEVKVAQLAGSIAELSAYHHGETSLMGTIVNMAQNYVGSNNLNTLVPHGQFGTRHMGGKDSASPRYICTMLSTLTRLVFPISDDYVLNFLYEDNQKIEPEWYCPIIPMCLVNGAEGIGTGYSTKIPNHDVREVMGNIRKMIAGEDPEPMAPSYKNFTGSIERVDEYKFSCCGTINIIDETTMEITELPIKTWTQSYKESVMDVFLYGTDKVPACITDYKEYHTDCNVKFQITMTPEQLNKAEQEGLHKKFKLDSNLNMSNIVLFDEYGCLKKYNNTLEILREFYAIRMKKYKERKEFMVGMLQAEASRLENQARFILEKIEGKIVIENRTKRDVVTTLVERGFVSDPVKAWKTKVAKDTAPDDESEAPVTDFASSTSTTSGGPDFQYLLTMAIMSLSKERKDELLRQRDQKKDELDSLLSKSPEDLWISDLDAFSEELEKVEEQERRDELVAANLVKKSGGGRAGAKKGRKVEVKSQNIKKFDKKPKEPSKAALKKVKDAFGFDSDSVKSEETTSTTSVAAASSTKEPESTEPLSLADRLKKKKQSTLSFQPKKPAAKKSTAKFSDTSDSEADELTIDDFTDDDDDDDYQPPKRKNAKNDNKKLVIDDSDSDNKDDDDGDDESNPEVAETRALIERLTPKKNKPTTSDSGGSGKTGAAKKKDIFGSGGKVDDPISLEDDGDEVISSPKKQTATKAATSKKETTKTKETTAGTSKAKKSTTTATAVAEDPKQKKISFGKKPAATKKSTKLFGDTDSDVELVSPIKKDNPTTKTASPKKKSTATAPKQSVAVKRKNKSKTSDDEEIKKPKKSKSVATTKPKPAKKARRRFEDSDDDGDDDKSDVSFNPTDSPVQVPTRERGASRRAATTKKKTYKFSSDEDENDDDDDDDFC